MYKIIDIHTHTYPDAIAERAKVALEKFYVFECEGKGTVSDLSESSKAGGVVGMLLLSVSTNPRQTKNVNLWAAESMKMLIDDGFEVAAFGGIHQDSPDMVAEVDQIKALGLSGVKIHPDIQGVDIDDERMYKLYALCEGELPIYFHMGDDRPEYRFSEADKLIKVMRDFPRLKVIAAHLGGYCAWDKTKDLVREGGNRIMFDTSSALWAMPTEKANELVRIIGTDRLMFGTDYPVLHAKSELELFMKLDLTEKEREDVLYNNAKKFLNFKSK